MPDEGTDSKLQEPFGPLAFAGAATRVCSTRDYDAKRSLLPTRSWVSQLWLTLPRSLGRFGLTQWSRRAQKHVEVVAFRKAGELR